MNVTYGKGVFIQGETKLDGEIILGDHKLSLKSKGVELTATYIPLEKIVELRRKSQTLELCVRQTISYSYTASIQSNKKTIKELTQAIVSRRGLKKKFLSAVWVEQEG